jgi:general stress protein 26
MIKESNNPNILYQNFVKEYSITANYLKQINISKKCVWPCKSDIYYRSGESYPNLIILKVKNGQEGLL